MVKEEIIQNIIVEVLFNNLYYYTKFLRKS